MAKKARIVNDVATDVTEADPAGLHHPDIAAQFVTVPNAVVIGSRRVNGVWQHPDAGSFAPPVEQVGPRRKRLSRPEFKLQFTGAERQAIRRARAYDGDDAAQAGLAAALNDFFDIVEDPALTYVDLSHPSTIEGLTSLEAAGLLAEGRAAEIAQGIAE